MKTQALILLSLGFIAIYLNDDNHTEPSVSMEAVQTSQKPHNVDSSDIRFLALSISTPMRYSPGSGTHHRFSPPSSPQPNSPVTNGTHHRFSPPSSPQPNSPVTDGTHHRFSPPSSPQPNSPVTNGTHHRFSPPSSPQPNSPVTDGTHHRFSPPSSPQPNSPVTNGTHHRSSPPSSPQPNSPVTDGTHHRFSPPSSPQPNSPVTDGTHHRFSPPSSLQPNSPVTNQSEADEGRLNHMKHFTHVRANPTTQKIREFSTSLVLGFADPITTHSRNSPPSSPKPDSPVTYEIDVKDGISVFQMVIAI